MPVPFHFDAILNDLIAGTVAGKVDWEPVVTRSAFATSVRGFTVSVAKDAFGLDAAFEMRVMAPDGNDIDRFAVTEGADPRLSQLWAAVTSRSTSETKVKLAPLAAGLRELVGGPR